MNNILSMKLASSDLPKSVIDQIHGFEFNIAPGLTSMQRQALLDAEMEGIKRFLLASSLLTFLSSLIVETMDCQRTSLLTRRRKRQLMSRW